MRHALVTALLATMSACGPGPDRVDAGDEMDGAAHLDAATRDTGEPCTEEGRYDCTPLFHQCCGGFWRDSFDGPCWRVDGGGFDAGPLDCTGSPHVPGCPCATDGAEECRPNRDTLACTGGIWVERTHVSCCMP